MTRVLAVVGPTASGKSALAVRLARELDGEVIGTDAMQVYRGMDIGTATPTAAERGGVPHWMVDLWDPAHAVSVAEFQAQARRAIADVAGRGRVPIVVGGSGLYVAAVLDDLSFPGTDPAVRQRLDVELAMVGAPALHERLREVDPQAAASILPTNGRRIVRALEVVEITGRPFVATLPEPVDVYSTTRIGLDVPRAELDARIARRVDAMWADGLVEEVRHLPGLESTPTASRALGYRQVLDLLAGRCTEAEARQATVDATRRFARRQQRWFRRDGRIRWLAYDSPTLVADALAAWGSDTDTKYSVPSSSD